MLNAVCSRPVNSGVMWLMVIMKGALKGMNPSQQFSARLFRISLLAPVLLCAFFLPSHGILGGQRNRITLTDSDRATIIQSVLREVFNPKSNYEGEHLILAEGIRSEWIPRISGFNLKLMSREELESFEEPPHYYVIRLKLTSKIVEVIVNIYNMKDERYPEVDLHYSYRRLNGKWKGKYLYGGGN